ncbi:MAG: hypothetical protein EON54_16495 [Alcaligenaceae bacterium]|nr:MAG: hypothetical protein EON54_16495 [Alcaligenaceae bacterium]
MMAYNAKIVLDSVSTAGDRLTTMEVTFPRIVLAEFNTHRVFSRNSASTRAIPVANQLRKLVADPFVPNQFGKNQTGMQSYEYLEGVKHNEAVDIWLTGRDRALTTAVELMLGRKLAAQMLDYDPLREFVTADILAEKIDYIARIVKDKIDTFDLVDTSSLLDIHKQHAGRGLETYMWQTVIVTATEWSNFFALRANPQAQPEIREVAEWMQRLYQESEPAELQDGEWHLPYIQPDELHLFAEDPEKMQQVSAARCARVSYLTHDGKRDLDKDVELYERLAGEGHLSPLEHVATPEYTAYELGRTELGDVAQRRITPSPFCGNFRGWKQLRKFVPYESDFSRVEKE